MPPRPRHATITRSDEPLLFFAGAGREVRNDISYFFDASLRTDVPHVTLQLTLAGIGHVTRGGERHLLPAGWAFIERIPGAFQYGFAEESPGPYELMFVSMAGPVAQRWMRRIHRRFGRVLDLGIDSGTASLMRTLAGQPPTLDRYALSALLYALIMQIHTDLTGSRLRVDPRVSRAIGLIDAGEKDTEFTIATLAAALECSREHLTRRFRLATGQSPQMYLIERRLKLAAQALPPGAGKNRCHCAAARVSGANHLCHAFQQRWRITPARYRHMPSLTVLS